MLDWEAPLWRLQKDPGPAYRRYPKPRYRFDAPSGQYAAVYANNSWLGVFGEIFVDRGRRIGRSERDLLRHTYATLALLNGVPVKVVSEVLGHKDIATTLRTYAHVLPGMQGEAARTMDSVFFGQK